MASLKPCACKGLSYWRANESPLAPPVTPEFVALSAKKNYHPLTATQSRNHEYGIRSMCASAGSKLEFSIKEKLSENPLIIYSKTRCPYCRAVKDLFNRLGVKPMVIELDELGPAQYQLKNALKRLTGQSTVPNIFIGGKHIGGCSETMALHKKGELIPLLSASGLKVS